MKIIIFVIINLGLLFNPKYLLSNNLELSRKYLSNKISFSEFISKLDTSKSAILNFIIESDERNTDKTTRITNGPVEFFSIIDSILTKFSNGDGSLFYFFDVFQRVVDGSLGEVYSGTIRKYCDMYPEQFKKAIIKQGKDSKILSDYLFDAGMNFKRYRFINENSKFNNLILDWASYQDELKKAWDDSLKNNP